jgi:predicted nuclease of restriction endonuclease-like (RecB) superfamily
MLMNAPDYLSVLDGIKREIRQARHRAILAVAGELTTLYWRIGAEINARSAWGDKFIDNLSRDIRREFPDIKGYSVRNLRYMAKFARMFPDFQKVQAPLAQLSWYNAITLMDKVKNSAARLWYAAKAVEEGWSRAMLVDQIESCLHQRQVSARKATNFKERLSPPQGDLAAEALKDSYIADFIGYRKGMAEREIEAGLVRNIAKFLLELGAGFAFMGNQYHIEVEKEDFYIDLLFYHLKLRCFVVIELKNGDFKPEFAGKLNFYISAVDDLVKTPADNPTIGILLCRNKRGMIAEYALRDIKKPIGVSELNLLGKLPKKYEKLLPTAEDIAKRVLPP